MNSKNILLSVSIILLFSSITANGSILISDEQSFNEHSNEMFWNYDREPIYHPKQIGADVYELSTLDIPETFDLREVNNQNYVTSVKSQKGGTCWSHAVCACMEGNLLMTGLWNSIGKQVEPNLAEYHLDWWNGFNDFFNQDETGSEGVVVHNGAQCRIAAAYLSRGEGAVYSQLANDAGEQDAVWYSDAPDRFDETYELFYPNHIEIYDIGENLENIGLIKSKIMQQGPLTMVFRADNSFLTEDFVHYQPPSNNDPPNHNVVIIGWDDAKETQAPDNGAWLCKNSWGTGWGNNGYFWISYFDKYCCHEYDGDEWTASFIDVEPFSFDTVYYHDYHGWQEDFSLSNEAFNAFTSTEDEVLTAVSFFTCDNDVEFNVKIFDTFEEGGLKNELSNQIGSIEFKGFHTIELDQPVRLKKNDDFFIYLSLSDGGIPYDHSTTIWGFNIISKANMGESFYLDGTGNWIDLNSFDSSANFCIKGLVSKQADLSCDTTILDFGQVKTGSIVEKSIVIRNDGEPFSKLCWEIDNLPDWGSWTVSETQGDIFKEEGSVQLDFTVISPDRKNMDYTGEIRLVNKNDPEDVVIIQLTLSTPFISNSWLFRFFENHPLISQMFLFI
jgi:C1A family cysteine protease